jgi:hypothetical protein
MRTCCMYTCESSNHGKVNHAISRSEVLVVGSCGFFQICMSGGSKLSVASIQDVNSMSVAATRPDPVKCTSELCLFYCTTVSWPEVPEKAQKKVLCYFEPCKRFVRSP